MGAARPTGTGRRRQSPGERANTTGFSRLRAAAEIEVGRIVPDPDQPRTEFDPEAIARLAESLKAYGQIQPISVRWSDDMGSYLIVTGERRWRASILAGRPTIAAVLIEGERTESQVLEMQLVENCLREDLQPIEQAKAFRTLMGRNGWTAARLAEVLQLTGASVTRALALLELPCTVQDAVAEGRLAPSVAYEVSKLDDPEAQAEVASRVVAEGLSRAETVEAVRRAGRGLEQGQGGHQGPAEARDRPDDQDLDGAGHRRVQAGRRAVGGPGRAPGGRDPGRGGAGGRPGRGLKGARGRPAPRRGARGQRPAGPPPSGTGAAASHRRRSGPRPDGAGREIFEDPTSGPVGVARVPIPGVGVLGQPRVDRAAGRDLVVHLAVGRAAPEDDLARRHAHMIVPPPARPIGSMPSSNTLGHPARAGASPLAKPTGPRHFRNVAAGRRPRPSCIDRSPARIRSSSRHTPRDHPEGGDFELRRWT